MTKHCPAELAQTPLVSRSQRKYINLRFGQACIYTIQKVAIYQSPRTDGLFLFNLKWNCLHRGMRLVKAVVGQESRGWNCEVQCLTQQRECQSGKCTLQSGDHNGNKFYNFLCYPRLFRQYVHVIFIIIIYIFVCSYYVLIIRTVRFCQINQIKSKKKIQSSLLKINISIF